MLQAQCHAAEQGDVTPLHDTTLVLLHAAMSEATELAKQPLGFSGTQFSKLLLLRTRYALCLA